MFYPQNNHKPLFHSRNLIFVFTVFVGPFFGALLFSQNLKEVGKRNHIAITIIMAFVYNHFALRSLAAVGIVQPILRFFLGSIVGAAILAGPVWHYQLSSFGEYDQRPIFWPLLSIVIFYAFLFILNLIFPGSIGR